MGQLSQVRKGGRISEEIGKGISHAVAAQDTKKSQRQVLTFPDAGRPRQIWGGFPPSSEKNNVQKGVAEGYEKNGSGEIRNTAIL